MTNEGNGERNGEWTADTDLHCHLLPAWDDGPPDENAALELARRLVWGGVRTLAVTPHVGRESVYARGGEPPARAIPEAVRSLQARLKDANIPLKLLPFAELTFGEGDLEEQLTARPWLTLDGKGRFVLIESTFGVWPRFADNFLYRLSLQGVTPIIAHPERLPDVQHSPKLMETCVRSGCVLQLTARSIVTPDDKKSGKCARELLEMGLVGIVASDAHRAESAVTAQEVRAEVIKIVGDEEARRVLCDNPRRIASGQDARPAPLGEREAGRSGGWLSRLAGFGKR